MTRQLFSLALGACLLALLPPSHADAVEMPVRKAGLWEMKTVQTGSPMPEMTMQQCTDADHRQGYELGFLARFQEIAARSRTSRRPRPATSPIPCAASAA